MSVDLKELRVIMKECVKLGVTRLKVGDVELEFGGELRLPAPRVAKKEFAKPNPDAEASIERETVEIQKRKFREDEIENLILEDPEEFERMELTGELVDGEVAEDRRTESNLQ